MERCPLLRRLGACLIFLGVPVALAAQQPLQAATGVVRDTAGKALGGADLLDPVVVVSRRTGSYGAVGDTSYPAAVGRHR